MDLINASSMQSTLMTTNIGIFSAIIGSIIGSIIGGYATYHTAMRSEEKRRLTIMQLETKKAKSHDFQVLKQTYSRILGQKHLLLTLYLEYCKNRVWGYRDNIAFINFSNHMENVRTEILNIRLQAIKKKEANIENVGEVLESIQIEGEDIRDEMRRFRRENTENRREISIELAKAKQRLFEDIGLIQSLLNYPCELDEFQKRLDSSAFIMDLYKEDEDLNEWFSTQIEKAICYASINIEPIINELLDFLANQISKEEKNFTATTERARRL